MFDLLSDLLTRQWSDLLARPGGPMAMRFWLQPTMAILLAVRDGIKDAHTGQSPYFWAILHDPATRRARLRLGLHATARIIACGLIMDAIYQIVAFRTFYPVEAIVVALALAFVPYLLVRGPIDRITRWWERRHPRHSPEAK